MWWRTDPLEEKMDAASHDHYVYLQGFYAGKAVGRDWATWLYRDAGKKPCPSTEPDSPYRRLIRHYEKLWKRRYRCG